MAVVEFATLLILIYSANNALCQPVLQPMDIKRMEGAKNVIIPCPVYNAAPPIWNINGNYYNINNLPQEYRPALIGIVIPIIYRYINGTSFQCFYSMGNGIQVQQSSIGILSVVAQNDEAMSLIVIGNQDKCLYLDHTSIFFGESCITIGIKTEQNTSDCNMFSLEARDECEQDLENPALEMWPFNDGTIIKINSTYSETSDGRLTFFDVIGKHNESTDSVCRRGQAAFQINPNAITEELHVPILRSEEIKFSSPLTIPLYAIIPTGNNNATVEKDCICSLVFLQNSTMICTNLSKCLCLGNTSFTPSMIEICRTRPLEITIVLRNLSPSTNNTQIFFIAYDQCEERPSELYWEYVKSYEIKQVLPELPNVTINEETEKICISSPLEGGIPADEYRITVYDTTGGITFSTTLNLDDANCTLVEPSFQVLECAPFTVAVQAMNVAGHSKVHETIRVNDGRSDTCSCINNRVIVNMNGIEDVEKIRVNFICHKVDYESDVMFLIGINNLPTINISCNDEKLFQNLSCRESYNVSVYWKSSLNSSLPVCLLDELIALTPQCPPSTEPGPPTTETGPPSTETGPPSTEPGRRTKVAIIAPVTVAATIALIIAVLVIISCFIVQRHKKKNALMFINKGNTEHPL